MFNYINPISNNKILWNIPLVHPIPLLEQLERVICTKAGMSLVADHIEQVSLFHYKPKWGWLNHESVFEILQVYGMSTAYKDFLHQQKIHAMFSPGRFGNSKGLWTIDCRWNADFLVAMFGEKSMDPNDEIDGNCVVSFWIRSKAILEWKWISTMYIRSLP